MKTLYHPNSRDLSIEVADADVDAYVAQGWRKTPKNFDKVDAQPDPTTATANSSASGEDKKKEVI